MLAGVCILIGAPVAFSVGSLDQIRVQWERQDVFKDGRQKFVVTVTNSSKELFKGTVQISGVDVADSTIDWDTIFLNDGLAPNGAKKFAILWLKNASRITSVKYSVAGKFQTIKVGKIDVPFEETGLRPGLNYMNVFVYTPVKDRESLQKIIAIYKKRYNSLRGFQIMFFNDKAKAARDLPMSDAALSCQFASYFINKSNGKEGLEFVK